MSRIVSLLCAMVAMIGILTLTPAVAQQAQTAGPISLGEVFAGPDSVDPIQAKVQELKDAIQRSPNPGQCPKGKVTVFVKKGDELFQQALAAARRDALKAAIGDQASQVFFDSDWNGTRNDVRVDHNFGRDREPPKLTVTSMPEKGKKVTAGQRITVKAIASDDANRWQTGIKSIDLAAQGGGPFGFQDYAQPPTTCERPPSPRTLQGVYTVPANPPPLVRLRATAKDFAGNEIDLLANFPTGDWYGWIDWRIPFPGGRLWGRLGLAFDYDGQGNLKGRMAGDSHVETQPRGAFCGMTTQTPAKNSANLVGQYTPGTNAMSLRVADPQIEHGQFSMCAVGPDGGPLPMSGQPFEGSGPIGQPGLAQLLNSFTVRADGSVEASGEWPVSPASPTPMTLHMKLTLHRAQN